MTMTMTVAQLIAFLQTQPQDLPVAYCCYSEQVLLEADDIRLVEACKPRPDGWIQDKRPDKETQMYLLFPGN
jgi:hypothetical protein